MKRICFISLSAYGYFNEDAPSGGGAERQFYLLSTSLVEHFDVHFIVGDYGQPRTEQREGVTLHRSYSPDANSSAAQRAYQLEKMWRALRQAAADLYLTRCSPAKLAIIYPLVTTLRRPLLFHVAGDPFVEKPVRYVDGLRQLLYHKAVDNSAAVVAQTQYQATQLQKDWDIASPVIPNGYPPAPVVDTHDSREYFLWVGRLDERQKQPHLFLDLAAQYPDQDFVIVGPEDGRTEYTERIKKRAATLENVSYTGPVKPTEIHDYYRQAIALVCTSAYEGFPNTFLEAWRYATPVISLDVDTGRFLDGDTNLTGYAGGDFSKLSQFVQQLAESVQLRRKLGILGMKTFTNQYQLRAVVDSYRRVIDDVLEE